MEGGLQQVLLDSKELKAGYRDLLESAPDAMVIVGREGHIALVNSQTERLFGYSRLELLGQHVEILVPERYRAKHQGHRATFFQQPRARAMGAGLDLYGLRHGGRIWAESEPGGGATFHVALPAAQERSQSNLIV